jgi:hypothetical protein
MACISSLFSLYFSGSPCSHLAIKSQHDVVYLDRQRRNGIDGTGHLVSKSCAGEAIELEVILRRYPSRFDSIDRDGFDQADEARAVGAFGIKDVADNEAAEWARPIEHLLISYWGEISHG